ncbi:4746_t:CDS:2 [Racocetra persica]|uniref:4746_t:CDS:1 n=1 Tax=Racocetra persica TaxID=160502 RepID=A0ACA9LQA2_9GLOM|nr:4746_t:CDS:2 [Racocetra persica]
MKLKRQDTDFQELMLIQLGKKEIANLKPNVRQFYEYIRAMLFSSYYKDALIDPVSDFYKKFEEKKACIINAVTGAGKNTTMIASLLGFYRHSQYKEIIYIRDDDITLINNVPWLEKKHPNEVNPSQVPKMLITITKIAEIESVIQAIVLLNYLMQLFYSSNTLLNPTLSNI